MTRKKIIRIVPFILGGLFVLAYVLLAVYVENAVEDQLTAQHGRASRIDVNLLTLSVSFKNLELLPSDQNRFGLQVGKLEVARINAVELLRTKRIFIGAVEASNGKLIIDRSASRDTASLKSTKREIRIGSLSLKEMMCEIRDDTTLLFSGIVGGKASQLSRGTDSISTSQFAVKAFDVEIKQVNINQNIGQYRVAISKFHFNSDKREINVDSLLLIPKFGKFEFTHQAGEQIARLNAAIPKIIVEGIKWENCLDSVFTASKIKISSAELHSFKDKRVHFLRTKKIPLPMEALSNLRWSIEVDSLIIDNLKATIEEIGETGTESGTATIERINAACGQITNRAHRAKTPSAILKASGFLMGAGEINASFSLPIDGSPTYVAKGSVGEMALKKLNPLLENRVRMRVESGQIHQLTFNFHYTDLRSTGTLEIDYDDLKLTSLNKNKDTNELKTVLINTILRDEKKDNTRRKHTGAINIARDQKRYVFHVWVTSLLDGLKSAALGD